MLGKSLEGTREGRWGSMQLSEMNHSLCFRDVRAGSAFPTDNDHSSGTFGSNVALTSSLT
jgi:hypothetical protein